MRQFGKYTFILIAAYVGATQWTGVTKDIAAGADGFVKGAKVLQGR